MIFRDDLKIIRKALAPIRAAWKAMESADSERAFNNALREYTALCSYVSERAANLHHDREDTPDNINDFDLEAIEAAETEEEKRACISQLLRESYQAGYYDALTGDCLYKKFNPDKDK